MPYFPITEEDEKKMLDAIGVRRFDELLAGIPAKLLNPDIRLPEPAGEMALTREIRELALADRTDPPRLSFLGAGIYEHFIPSAVDHLARRGEFFTAYTPYQPEASQGTLQAIFEFQTLLCRLTGLPVSTASHYDGATALAEAALLALRAGNRTKVLVAENLHPHMREVLRTYLAGLPAEILEIPFDTEGLLDRDFLDRELTVNTACVIAGFPNFFGIVEDYSALAAEAHANGALFIAAVNPMSLSFYLPPGEWGADIAVGEAQPLGIPMSLGGPGLGFFAARQELLRRLPGRIAGETRDSRGRRAFVLTLQAREQHIRREKATSNICSNQALMALRATIYLALLGEQGFRRVGEMNAANAAYLRGRIARIPGFAIPFEAPVFNEFAVQFPGGAQALMEKLLERGILGGVLLEKYHPRLKDSFLVAATETKTREDLDRFVRALEEVSR